MSRGQVLLPILMTVTRDQAQLFPFDETFTLFREPLGSRFSFLSIRARMLSFAFATGHGDHPVATRFSVKLDMKPKEHLDLQVETR